jgi:hypothetical protein
MLNVYAFLEATYVTAQPFKGKVGAKISVASTYETEERKINR